ncbi:unnamed protein product [Absidia cylindrospora]
MPKFKKQSKAKGQQYSLVPSPSFNSPISPRSVQGQHPLQPSVVGHDYFGSSLDGSSDVLIDIRSNKSNNNNKTYGSADSTGRHPPYSKSTNHHLPPLHPDHLAYLAQHLPADNGYTSDADTTASPHYDDAQDDICMATLDSKDQTDIHYDALDRYIEEEAYIMKTPSSTPNAYQPQRRRLSTMGGDSRRFSLYGDRMKHPDVDDFEAYRMTYYSTAETSTIHARNLCEIPPKGTKLSDMLKKGCFWIDILNPTDTEMRSLCQVFRIHPLTQEDITMEEQREKCDVYHNYYFICFRSFEQDPLSPMYLQPLAVYIVVLKEGVLSFHFRHTPHPRNVRKRIKQLRDYINVSPDWICYGLLDDITDSFAPLIKSIEFEVDSIDELVLILKESEQSDMLRRIGYCRKRVMGLLRLLVPKADVVKTLIKRGETKPDDATRPALGTEVLLFLGDVQDHILTMLQSLNHYEKISSRSHSNYLAQISIEMTQTNNEINDVLSKLTALGSVLVPMNLITGLFGINVKVPGEDREDLTWFYCITASILTFCITMTLIMRHYNIV